MQPPVIETREWFDLVRVLAALVSGMFGAIVALVGQAIYSRRKETKQRRLQIFRTLMATRAGAFAHPTQVEALNAIDIEFYDKRNKHRTVIEAWRVYSEHLNGYPNTGTADESNRWTEKRVDLLVKLLQEMARTLGYPFDEVMLRRNAYYPTGWHEEISETIDLRRAAISVFTGKTPLRVETKTDPEDLQAFTAAGK
jgi:hypothetical protein